MGKIYFWFDAIHKDLLDPKSPIEAAKGFLDVASIAALLDIAHRGAQRIAEELVQHLHVNIESVDEGAFTSHYRCHLRYRVIGP